MWPTRFEASPWPWTCLAQIPSHQGGPAFTVNPRVCPWHCPEQPLTSVRLPSNRTYLPGWLSGSRRQWKVNNLEQKRPSAPSYFGRLTTAQPEGLPPIHCFFSVVYSSAHGRIFEQGTHYQQKMMCASALRKTQPPNVCPHGNVSLSSPNHSSFPRVGKRWFTETLLQGLGNGLSARRASACFIFTITPISQMEETRLRGVDQGYPGHMLVAPEQGSDTGLPPPDTKLLRLGQVMRIYCIAQGTLLSALW